MLFQFTREQNAELIARIRKSVYLYLSRLFFRFLFSLRIRFRLDLPLILLYPSNLVIHAELWNVAFQGLLDCCVAHPQVIFAFFHTIH